MESKFSSVSFAARFRLQEMFINDRLPRKILIFLLVLGTHLVKRSHANAQDAPAVPVPRQSVRHIPTLEDQVKSLTQRLNLDANQQAMVKIILERRQTELLEVYKDGSLSAVDRFAALKAVHERSDDRISRILNADQLKKFDQMRNHTPSQNQIKSGVSGPKSE
jgi:hypothetical protein